MTGYALSSNSVQPGEELVVTVWWSASGPLDADYNVFGHLLNGQGELIAQADGPPRSGNYPTGIWGQETIIDKRIFVIPATADSGSTIIRIGFYRLDDGTRLLRTDDTDLPDYAQFTGPMILEGD